MTVKRYAFGAFGVFVLDGLFFQWRIISFAIAGISVISATVRLLRKHSTWREERWRAGPFVLAALLTYAVVGANNAMSRRRALVIAHALDEYHAKYQHYPEDAGALVPEFLPSIPLARYTLFWPVFIIHLPVDGEPSVSFINAMPEVRAFYRVEQHTWGYRD